MDHHHTDPLKLGERFQRREKRRFERRKLRSGRLWKQPVGTPSPPRRSLPNSIQVTGRVLHRTDARPVLPAIRQRLRGRLRTNLGTVGRHERSAQPWSNHSGELFKRHNQLKHLTPAKRDRPLDGPTSRSSRCSWSTRPGVRNRSRASAGMPSMPSTSFTLGSRFSHMACTKGVTPMAEGTTPTTTTSDRHGSEAGVRASSPESRPLLVSGRGRCQQPRWWR